MFRDIKSNLVMLEQKFTKDPKYYMLAEFAAFVSDLYLPYFALSVSVAPTTILTS